MTQNLPGFIAEATLGSALHNHASAVFLLAMRQVGISDLSILRAMERLPRALFLPERYQDLATLDIGVPIGSGQTSTAPSQIGLMLQALMVEPHHRVLEIGTGSGYATALLAELAGSVVSLERSKTLCEAAKARMLSLACQTVRICHDDGLCPQNLGPQNLGSQNLGSQNLNQDHAHPYGQFDRILVHGTVTKLPAWLIDALAPDGVMLVPHEIKEKVIAIKSTSMPKNQASHKNMTASLVKIQRVLRYFYESQPVAPRQSDDVQTNARLMVQPLHQCQFVPLMSGLLHHS